MENNDEVTGEQDKNTKEWLKPWQFKPGQSGNPSGRPKGSVSLKEFARKYLREMTDEEKIEFLEGMNKKDVWEMGEDKAKQGTELSGGLTISQVLDSLEDGPKT